MRHTRSPRLSAIHNIDALGTETFREAICTYLRTARAVHCEPHQVMVVAGSQQALEISARVLLGKGSSIWIEDPGYRLARNVFAGAGCNLIPVPVDEDGMVVSAGIKRCPKARAAYVTPSHQYPLGATMSAARRMQLLNWAQSAGSWIIEDDYDSEYRFESAPISSLQGLDSECSCDLHRNLQQSSLSLFAPGLHRHSGRSRGPFHRRALGHGHFPALPLPGDHQRLHARRTFRSPHPKDAIALWRTKNRAGQKHPGPTRARAGDPRQPGGHASCSDSPQRPQRPGDCDQRCGQWSLALAALAFLLGQAMPTRVSSSALAIPRWKRCRAPSANSVHNSLRR